jgi:glycine cleavage system regulatory protein
MKESLVMTLIGKDRPGLVESLAAVVAEHGGNWEESRMVQLAGEFAGLLQVEAPSDRVDGLLAALTELEELSVTVERVRPAPEDAEKHLLKLELVGQDDSGIVHSIAKAMARQGINIEELESGLVDAPMSGEPLFKASALLRAPASVELDVLQAELEQLAADLMVDIQLQ